MGKPGKTSTESFCPSSKKQWRQWLRKNHAEKQSVWLICYKVGSGKPTVSWSEAVEEALCFGWIDSKRKPIDEEKFMQFFSKRQADSTWSLINKEKVQKLIDAGHMTPAGLACIETARQNGSWNILDEVEALVIPGDLAAALEVRPGAVAFFRQLSKSDKKAILSWLVFAKRPETRRKRIDEVVRLADEQQIPKQFR